MGSRDIWAFSLTLFPAHGRRMGAGAEQQMNKLHMQCLQNSSFDHRFTFPKLLNLGLTQLQLKLIKNFQFQWEKSEASSLYLQMFLLDYSFPLPLPFFFFFKLPPRYLGVSYTGIFSPTEVNIEEGLTNFHRVLLKSIL